MGVDSKLFVICNEAEKMEVGKVALDAMKELAYNLAKQRAEDLGIDFWQVCKSEDVGGYFTRSADTSSYDFETFTINFGVGDENGRCMYMHFDCRCDVAEYLEEHEDAVIFSIGCWGSNTLIMQTLAEALAEKWPVYYDMNDCDGVPYQLFEGEIQ